MRYEVTTAKLKCEFDNRKTVLWYANSMLVHNKWVMVRKVLKNPRQTRSIVDDVTFDDIIRA